jgi:hypothetical protein
MIDKLAIGLAANLSPDAGSTASSAILRKKHTHLSQSKACGFIKCWQNTLGEYVKED